MLAKRGTFSPTGLDCHFTGIELARTLSFTGKTMSINQIQSEITANSILKDELKLVSKMKKFLFALIFSTLFFFVFILLTGKTAITHIIISGVFSLVSAVIGMFIPSVKKRYYISLGIVASFLLMFMLSLMVR
jgi:hypothetical protein